MNDIKLFDACINDIDANEIVKTLATGNLASGQYVESLEIQFSKIVDKKYAISISNLSMAILLLLKHCGIKEGDDAIACSFSCMASNSPLALLGLNISWIDWDENTLNFSASSFESAITPNTKIAFIYHTAGYASDLTKIYEICKKKNIILVEDCNNAHLSKVNGLYVGQQSDYAVYSFYPNRIVNSIDGAIITTNNKIYAEDLKKLRRFGISQRNFRLSNGEINPSSDIVNVGYSANLDNISAQLALSSLTHHVTRREKVIENVNLLSESIKVIEQINIIKTKPNIEAIPWVFFIYVDNKSDLLNYLKSLKVHASTLHHLNHSYSCFKSKQIQIPNQLNLHNKLIGLPCGWWLNANQINYITNILKRFYNV